MPEREGEAEIIYTETKRRVLRGKIVKKDENEVVIERDDGTYTIPMKDVIRIKEPTEK